MAAGMIRLFTVVIAFTTVNTVKRSGPFDVHVRQIETCEDEGTGQFHWDNKISYVGGGKHIYNSPFRFGVPIDDKFLMKADLQKWSSQGWRPRALTYTGNGCKEIDQVFGSFLRSFYKSAGINVTECPFPMGNFTANNWLVDIKFGVQKEFIYGKWRAVMDFFYDKVKVGCLKAYLDTEPKKPE